MATPAPSLTAETGRGSRDFLIACCGFATSFLTALILFLIERWSGFALYTWMFWFVIPVGAIAAGFGGASGYLVGARLFGRRPSRIMLLNLLAVSVATFFFIHYLAYMTLVVEGRQVSDYISFMRFLDLDIRSTAMDFWFRGARLGQTGELGGFGYVVAVLQVLGFAAGGLCVFGHLQGLSYCERCSRYLVTKGIDERYTKDLEALDVSRKQVLANIHARAFAGAVAEFQKFGTGARGSKSDFNVRTRMIVRRCKRCDQHWMKYAIEKRTGKDSWSEMPEFTVAGFIDGNVSM